MIKENKENDNENKENISNSIENTINYGSYTPQVLNNSEIEYNSEMVKILIKKDKLAPFYKEISDYIDNPLEEKEIENKNKNKDNVKKSKSKNILKSQGRKILKIDKLSKKKNIKKTSNENFNKKNKNISNEKYSKEMIFKYPISCPICLRNLPRNINYTSCCDQPICTECLTQIKPIKKRNNLDIEIIKPPNCPYCKHSNLGVYYLSPESKEYKEQYEMLVKAKELNVDECQKLLMDDIIPKTRKDTSTLTKEQIVTSEIIYSNWHETNKEKSNTSNVEDSNNTLNLRKICLTSILEMSIDILGQLLR